MNGKYELKSFKITYDNDISSDDKEMLEDMINIALNDCIKKINDKTDDKIVTKVVVILAPIYPIFFINI